MSEQSTELLRLLRNIVRVGSIIEVDAENWLCRVSTGNLETNWLSWLTARAGTSKTWWKPSVGEQVLLLSIGGDLSTAFVLPAIFSNDNPPPSTSEDALVVTFPDGAKFQYDPASGQLAVSGIKTMTIAASTEILFDTPKVRCSTLLETPQLMVTQGGEMQGDISHSGGKFASNGVVLDAHKHSGVQTGGGNTGGPVK
ncbi:baseplate assembly protein [Ewingella americana]|nr:baseplate assembly protein [Ewingella americana]